MKAEPRNARNTRTSPTFQTYNSHEIALTIEDFKHTSTRNTRKTAITRSGRSEHSGQNNALVELTPGNNYRPLETWRREVEYLTGSAAWHGCCNRQQR